MTIDQALADLSIQLEVKHRLGQDHQANALLLSIEALKREVERRNYKVFRIPTLLPGETEE